MKFIKSIIIAVCFIIEADAYADKITVAAAANMKFAMDEVVANFLKANPSDKVDVIYVSSGKAHTQIQQGAPYDLFFSADADLPRSLVSKGLTASEVKLYAVGRIVLWSASLDATKMTLASLADSSISRIAIANPKHAPYGKRAEEALHQTDLWDKVKSKLVYGETVIQTAQFVQSGNAQVGIIALSSALDPKLASKGGYWLIPNNLHKPLEQGYVTLKRASANPLAKRFADFMTEKTTRDVMTRHGYIQPEEDAKK